MKRNFPNTYTRQTRIHDVCSWLMVVLCVSWGRSLYATQAKSPAQPEQERMQQSADVGSVIPVPEIHQDTPLEITDTCAYLKRWEYMKPTDPAENKLKYDTLRLYVEHCAASDDKSFTAFKSLDGAIGQIVPTTAARFVDYRNWLISVIYLNTTIPAYFCNCLNSIGGTYQHDPSIDPTTAYMTILDYLRKNPACYGTPMDVLYTNDSLYLIRLDKDPTKLPSLDSLGLGFLEKNSTAFPSAPVTKAEVLAYRCIPDPFTNNTTVSFTLPRMTYVTVGVYDVLGNMVWTSGYGKSMEAGEHSFRINGASFPVGTLYVRIVSGFGEVKTIKLIHR